MADAAQGAEAVTTAGLAAEGLAADLAEVVLAGAAEADRAVLVEFSETPAGARNII